MEWSADGMSWSGPLVTQEHPAESGGEVTPVCMAVRLPSPATGRFARVSFTRRGAWTMVDEVEVY